MRQTHNMVLRLKLMLDYNIFNAKHYKWINVIKFGLSVCALENMIKTGAGEEDIVTNTHPPTLKHAQVCLVWALSQFV